MRRVAMALVFLSLVAACASPSSQPASGGASPPGGAQAASAGSAAATSAPAAAARPPTQPLRIGVPLPSLSYLPARVAWKRGFFEEEGLAAEFPLVTGNAIMPAVMAGEIDFTTNLSSIGAHAGQGGDSKIVQFHSVRLQHVLVVRPDITDVQQLNGKRFAVQSAGTLPAFQVQKLAERYSLRDIALIAAGSESRAVVEAGAADAYVASVPENLISERNGYPTLLRFSSFLNVPQAGLGTSDATLRDKTDMVVRALRASARALPLLRSEREDVIRMIAEWIELSPEDAASAYDLVIDTFSPNGLPTEAQMRAYLALMQETANVPADATLERVFDFTLARRIADELGLPSQ